MAEQLGRIIAESDVVICCGSGGVGKTTTSAALGLQAARLGRRAVVITIDPARRLADALGVPGTLTNEPVRLDVPGPGELWATMLDAAQTFDGLVADYAADAEQAERILSNGFYRNVASSLSGTQEYMAAERLHALHGDDRFDVVIVDTPPTRSALDFLGAPSVLKRFIDHPLFKLLMLPARRGLRFMNIAAQPVLRTISKAVGGEVLSDAVAFFQAFRGMETGFRERADEVYDLVASPAAHFVLVASPRADTVEEAAFFATKLHGFGLAVGATVVNRATPEFGPLPASKPRSAPSRAAYENLAALAATSSDERSYVAEHLGELVAEMSWVPMLGGDVHEMTALEQIRAHLFGDFPAGSGSG